MKCNKCYQIIPPNEEIKEDHKCYCETCYKSDSWARTGSKIILGSFFLFIMVVFIGVIIYIWKNKNE